MKTFADFKRRIQKGVKLQSIFHQESAGRDEKGFIQFKDKDNGVREVNKVQTNSFTLLTTKGDGRIVDSWLQYPKASEVKILDENTILIFCEDWRVHNPERQSAPLIPLLTYKFVD